PGAADRVRQVELELRSIESALPRRIREVDAGEGQRFGERGLRLVPGLVAPRADVGPRRQPVLDTAEPHVLVNAAEELEELLGLLDDLVVAAEDVRVVLRELADAHDAV